MTADFPKIIIFAVYFGRLPDYFPLWLKSCSYNPSIEWRVITDADISPHAFPANVSHRSMTLNEASSFMASRAKVELNVRTPYKLCDLKPLYWTLVEPHDQCDFWGHCDLDMIFGNLRAFLTPEILEGHDKIFSVGHLTLYRNEPETNRFYEKPHPDLDYRAILADPAHRGFDEHIGVNRIWLHHRGRFHVDEAIVADIDPHIGRFERASNYFHFKNYRHQVFLFDHGCVRRLYRSGGRQHSDEFIYIHFQKRKLARTKLPEGCERFFITPEGFVPAPVDELTRADFDRLNGRPRLAMTEIRQRLRRIKRRIVNVRRECAA